MKNYLKTSLLFFVFAITHSAKDIKAQKTPESLGWKVGTQAYSFRMFTLEEALTKADSIGIKYIEGFPGQKIGGGIEGNLDFHMSAAKRDSVLQLLRKKGITMLSYGVITPRAEADWRQLFEFVKGMGLKQFVSEPEPEFIPLVSKLADEYQINVAFHNHPRPSRYWSPDTLIKYTAGYSKRLGSCADIGHFIRSGLDPIQSMKKLEGRIFELHMKDLNEKPSAEYTAYQMSLPVPGQPRQQQAQGAQRPQAPAGPHDVPWGTGISNIKAVLEELKRQNFKGPMFAEYEYNWYTNAPEIGKSVQYVSEVVSKMK
ncbi:MAG TPA: sugar phosphate isomerase/epimerase [Segetibacter sp.]|nr:sugar phosphate isomerase/epimerase [Segetibacter sp.]